MRRGPDGVLRSDQPSFPGLFYKVEAIDARIDNIEEGQAEIASAVMSMSRELGRLSESLSGLRRDIDRHEKDMGRIESTARQVEIAEVERRAVGRFAYDIGNAVWRNRSTIAALLAGAGAATLATLGF